MQRKPMFPWSPLFSNRDFEGPSGKDMNTSSFKYSTVTKKINPDGVSGKSFEFLQKKTPVLGFCLPSLKGCLGSSLPKTNHDVITILRNLIGCLRDWKLENTDKSCIK